VGGKLEKINRDYASFFLPQRFDNTLVTTTRSHSNPLWRRRRGRRFEVVDDDAEPMETERVRY
jgi:hypothetical protein